MEAYFKEEWLSDPLFEKWPVEGADKKSAKCKLRQVQFVKYGPWSCDKSHRRQKTRSEIKASILLLQTLTVNIHITSRSGSRLIG